jgi:hypothetical protein
MSRKSVRRAALGLLFAVLLGIAMPVPASAWSGASTGSFFSVIWEWLQELWPAEPDPVQPTCTEDCGDAGHGVDPNG